MAQRQRERGTACRHASLGLNRAQLAATPGIRGIIHYLVTYTLLKVSHMASCTGANSAMKVATGTWYSWS